ncbi:glycosyltransferase [Agromyces sp. SYSU T0242]|uniref:glycosyltransferase n=1 Tax=Agromyces litoreus TaxID=3158561 RepID=UPI003396D174
MPAEPTDATGPDVLVVTVAYRSSDAIGPFLDSIPDASPGLRIRTIVVDNASADADATAEAVRSRGVDFVGLDRNLGYGGGIDAGIDAARTDADFLLIVNPDVVFGKRAITTLLDAATTTPGGGSFGPRILTPAGEVYPSARRFPRVGTGVGHALFGRVVPGNPWSRTYRGEFDDADRQRPTDWLSGACLLVRMSAYRGVGGFDHGYFMYFEDVDLGRRLGQAGWSNEYVPTATVTHVGAKSTSTAPAKMLRAHHRSAYRFLSRQYDRWYHAPLRLALRTGLGIRAWWATRRSAS